MLLGILGIVIRYAALSFLTASVDRQLETDLRRSPPPPPPGFDFPPDRNPAEEESPPFFGRPGGDMGGQRGFGGRRGPRWEENPYGPHHWNPQGRSVMASDPRPLWDPDGFARAAQQGQTRYATVVAGGAALRVASAPVYERGMITSVVQVAYPLADINRAVRGMDRALLTLIPLGLLGAGMAGAYLTNQVLRRVRGTTRAAEQMTTRPEQAPGYLPVTAA